LEDHSGKQAIRYKNNLNEKEFDLLNLKDFDDTFDEELAKKRKQADNEISKEYFSPSYHRYKTLTIKNYTDMGCTDPKNKKLDRVSVIEQILNDAIKNEHDFICIDSLKSLLDGKERNFRIDAIQRIVKPSSENNITLLLVHHSTEDGSKMAITNDLKIIFDNVYKLEENKDSSINLILKAEKIRNHKKPDNIYISRTFIDDKIVQYKIISTTANYSQQVIQKNVKPDILIKEIIKNHSPESNIIEYNDLLLSLEKKGKKYHPSTIKGSLAKLRDEGYIKMKNNSTWLGGIEILRRE